MAQNLSDTQLILLSAASRDENGIIPIAQRLKGAVAQNVGEKLIRLGFAVERKAHCVQACWRTGEAGQSFALVITPLGLAAIGIDGTVPEDQAGLAADEVNLQETPALAREERLDATQDPSIASSPSPRSRSKKAQVIALLQNAGGTTLDELVAATAWLPHTVRALLTRLRQAGMPIKTLREAGAATRYRMVEDAEVLDATNPQTAGA